ncbi:hypothetical protein GF359_08925 [candidate division WOR-3 bacterium]|uniref:Uncharacterized protein n=1 Tax=candidate division WOR-3 bacterium TaxID=2052148 RepID=A0A9D5QDQ6_UNCW3|nr:hypothetical protein [candidate division WOR-3 bacterium]MBD3365322.1 hypothetical protein [candidate division WOR-3 bacterium]
MLYENDGEIGYHLSPQLGTSIDGGLYLGQTPWFVYLSEACLIEWDVYDWEWEMGVHFSPDITGEVFMGGGFGKARDVTAAAKAWDFYDELKVSANKDEIESLGELISTRWRYQLKHWYYPKYFYPDIETHLADCGIVERLEPYQTLRLREIVLGFPHYRLSGNRIRIGIGGTSEPWFYWFGSGWWWGVQSKIEGGYPLSRRWQVNWEGLGEILTQDFSSIEPTLRGRGELVYYLGDRFNTSAGIDAFYWSVFQPGLEYRVGVRLPLSLNLYIEDKVNLTATLSYDIHGGEDRLNNSMSVFGKLWLQASIAWRLM